MDFDAFVESAWNDHADRPEEVADRLANSLSRVESAAAFAPYARLVVHVHGEHLGRWDDGIDLLESMRDLPAWDGSPAARGALERGIATLRYARGDGALPDDLAMEDRIAVLAGAAAIFAGRNEFASALASYRDATDLAAAGLPDGSPALRALAVGGNNLAAALEERTSRNPAETAGMVAAAQAGLLYWKRAGTWLEEERALYRLARSQLEARDPVGAMHSAQRCVEVCDEHQAPPFELYFAHAALAFAQRAAGDAAAFAASRERAFRYHELVDPDEKPWCKSDLDLLQREPQQRPQGDDG